VKVLFFAHRGHLKALKVCDLKFDEQKTKPSHTIFLKKINWLNQLIIKLACLMQHRQKYKAKVVMKVWVLKLKYVNSMI
jgi:hypothetical protein